MNRAGDLVLQNSFLWIYFAGNQLANSSTGGPFVNRAGDLVLQNSFFWIYFAENQLANSSTGGPFLSQAWDLVLQNSLNYIFQRKCDHISSTYNEDFLCLQTRAKSGLQTVCVCVLDVRLLNPL